MTKVRNFYVVPSVFAAKNTKTYTHPNVKCILFIRIESKDSEIIGEL